MNQNIKIMNHLVCVNLTFHHTIATKLNLNLSGSINVSKRQ